MAEKKKKSPPKFGGKRALKDTSGDGKITFADTFLGDLLGFDGKAGTKGKAGLLKSLGGARRMKDGVTTSKRPKARPASVTTAAKTKAASEAARKKKATLASETRRQQSQVKKKAPTGPVPVRRGDGTEAGTPRGPGRNTNPIPINKKRKPGTFTNPIPIKPKTPTRAEKKASQKRMMKRITLEDWKNLTKEEKIMRGLPKDNQEVFGLTGSLTLGAKRFTDAFKANRGGLAKKSGYMYGGSVTKKKPLTKMSKGGMVKKK